MWTLPKKASKLRISPQGGPILFIAVCSLIKDLLEDLLHPVTCVHGIKHILPQPVAQAEGDDPPHVFLADLRPPVEGRVGPGSPVRDNVPSEPVDVQLAADLGDLGPDLGRDRDVLQALPGFDDLIRKLLVARHILFPESLGVIGKLLAAIHNLDAELGVTLSADERVHAETVEELRSKLTLLRVATADEDEFGRVPNADALALHGVPAACRTVEQYIHQVVIQEIHFVHIEDAAVGLG
mmetsp:Transcript_123317/g.343428  ORF Transcript_123317/g.343428 Transcript_123317/m.343428 type:complete len:239 (+) Transcript_123317:17-733(+)